MILIIKLRCMLKNTFTRLCEFAARVATYTHYRSRVNSIYIRFRQTSRESTGKATLREVMPSFQRTNRYYRSSLTVLHSWLLHFLAPPCLSFGPSLFLYIYACVCISHINAHEAMFVKDRQYTRLFGWFEHTPARARSQVYGHIP